MSITLAQVAKFRDDADAQAMRMFELAVQSFFASVPVKFVAFKVYAPSFNDGDACLPRFQSEVAYCFIDQDTIEEDFDGLSYIDEMAYAIKLDPWSYSKPTLTEAKDQLISLTSDHEDEKDENDEPYFDFSTVTTEHLEAILEFQKGIQGIGHDFFYNRGEDGLYVLSRTGMDVLEVDIEY
jgi:hypothetical protein